MNQQENNVPTFSFLREQIDSSISTLKPKVEKHKSKAQWVNGASIVLGALITLTLGLKITGYEGVQQNIALALGALLTIVSGWIAVFDHKKLWVRQKSTLLDLYHLKNHLNYCISSERTSEEFAAEIFEKYQDIWERDSNEWRSIIYKPQLTKQVNIPNK
ncbi:SLATT domain-containing protein [Photobacterium sp. Alg240-V54]|uniref:SLATT domain-containing protein n=1 Tax=Photobacterium sp. Alg240-V54 TaxID=2305995 RepID=UPI0013D03690|nr:DUF4231 domain-containing protein [Photobacterium sp. Alg240-V54]